MDSSIKVRENRLRRMAERQGLRLVKSKRRDPRAIDYGVYWLVDANTDVTEAGRGSNTTGNLSLDDVERILTT